MVHHVPEPKGSMCNAEFEEFLTLLFRFHVDSLQTFKNNTSNLWSVFPNKSEWLKFFP